MLFEVVWGGTTSNRIVQFTCDEMRLIGEYLDSLGEHKDAAAARIMAEECDMCRNYRAPRACDCQLTPVAFHRHVGVSHMTH